MNLKRLVLALLTICLTGTAAMAVSLPGTNQVLVAKVVPAETVVLTDSLGNLIRSYGSGGNPALSPDGRYLATKTAFGISVWETTKYRPRHWQVTQVAADITPCWVKTPFGLSLVVVRQSPGSPHRLIWIFLGDLRNPVDMGEVTPDIAGDQAHPAWRCGLLTWDTNQGMATGSRKIVAMHTGFVFEGDVFDLVNIPGQDLMNGSVGRYASEVAYVGPNGIYRKPFYGDSSLDDPSQPGTFWAAGNSPCYAPDGTGIYFDLWGEVYFSGFDGVITDLGVGSQPSVAVLTTRPTR